MVKQKTVSKTKEEVTKPKSGKRRRSKEQIERVKKKGKLLAGMVGAIIALSSIRWKVSSETVHDLWYVVTLGSRGIICQCNANAGGKMICKHAFGVHRLLELEWWKNRHRKKIRIKRQRIRRRNSKCLSKKVVRYGKRKCKRKRPVQRYLCKSCGQTFSGIDGFVGRHFDADVIIKALSMVAKKMSPDEARDQLKLDDIKIDASTIHRWADCYSGMMYKYAAALRVDAGHQWHVDEIFFKVLKKKRYLFAVMDGASRFILSYEISPLKQGFKPAGLFAAAASRTFRLPRILVSDGLQDFIGAAKKIFYRNWGPRFVHIREIHLQNLFNQNNVYERLNGEFRDRLKCTRGLKSDNPYIIRLLISYHNFFREHKGLENNMTPAEAIGIDIMPVPDLTWHLLVTSGSRSFRMRPSTLQPDRHACNRPRFTHMISRAHPKTHQYAYHAAAILHDTAKYMAFLWRLYIDHCTVTNSA